MTTSNWRDPVLSYAPKPTRVSRFAIVALGMAVLGAVTFFLVVPSLIALLLGMIASVRIQKRPGKLAGMGFATAAVTVSLCAFCLAVLTFLLMPRFHCDGLSDRSYCAANLRGIMQSMVVYSNDNNDRYPVVAYAPYSSVLNSPTANAAEPTDAAVLKSYYRAPFPQAGSVTACVWMLVLNEQCSPKQFICKSDPTATMAGLLQAPGENYYDNFQSDRQISYSAAYPWKVDGSVGKWWTNTTDSSLPILADMAPEQGTGSPRRDLTSATATGAARNSANHGGAGQEIAFADCHTEWCSRPDAGQGDDNIFTTSGRPSVGPAQFGGLPAGKTSPELTVDRPPFDIIMYPIRNLDTGRM